MYGLDHNKERFSADLWSSLRPETSIPNLYLTGRYLSSFRTSWRNKLINTKHNQVQWHVEWLEKNQNKTKNKSKNNSNIINCNKETQTKKGKTKVLLFAKKTKKRNKNRNIIIICFILIISWFLFFLLHLPFSLQAKTLWHVEWLAQCLEVLYVHVNFSIAMLWEIYWNYGRKLRRLNKKWYLLHLTVLENINEKTW